jgi:hypothetical protein
MSALFAKTPPSSPSDQNLARIPSEQRTAAILTTLSRVWTAPKPNPPATWTSKSIEAGSVSRREAAYAKTAPP